MSKKKEEHDARWWANARREYIAKNDKLFGTSGWYYCDPTAFYSRLFAGVELEKQGQMIDWNQPGGGKPNAIVLEITNEKRQVMRDGRPIMHDGKPVEEPVIRRYTLTEDLDGVMPLVEQSLRLNTTMFVGPVTYFGKNRTAKNARFLHAFTIDLDGVWEEQLSLILYQMRVGIYPQASAIINSGTGLHLYFMLDHPVPLYPKYIPWLQALKTALTNRVWNEDTSDQKKRQYQGIFQGFRMVGTTTKLNGGKEGSKLKDKYETVAFTYEPEGKLWRVDLDYLLDQVDNQISDNSVLSYPLEESHKVVWTALDEAKQKWPEWYQRRIVDGKPAGRWNNDRALYDWWLAKLKDGKDVTVHHRYHCLRALVAFAEKVGIDREDGKGISRQELEADMWSLLPIFESKTETPDNHFTEVDVLAAIKTIGKGTNLSRKYIEHATAIPMPANKRNGRKQEVHLAGARAIQKINDEFNGTDWRDGNGRKPKANLIRKYAYEHPKVNHSQIAEALGVSRTTVIKWLKPGWREEYEASQEPPIHATMHIYLKH